MVLNSRSKLKVTVEVDETLLGGKKPGKRGSGAEGKCLIVIAVEVKGRKTGRARLFKKPDESSESLYMLIEDNIEKASKVITDAWSGYNGLVKLGYVHEIQKPTVKDEDGVDALPNVHRIASLLKR